MTAFLAGTVALEILTLFCHAKGLIPDNGQPGRS
jgi:hypothetical protein